MGHWNFGHYRLFYGWFKTSSVYWSRQRTCSWHSANVF